MPFAPVIVALVQLAAPILPEVFRIVCRRGHYESWRRHDITAERIGAASRRAQVPQTICAPVDFSQPRGAFDSTPSTPLPETWVGPAPGGSSTSPKKCNYYRIARVVSNLCLFAVAQWRCAPYEPVDPDIAAWATSFAVLSQPWRKRLTLLLSVPPTDEG